MDKRTKNEKTFKQWSGTPNGGRKYWYDVAGANGWKARYVKEVDAEESTVRFYQEIYNGSGVLVEIHRKYPVDEGHKSIKEGGN